MVFLLMKLTLLTSNWDDNEDEGKYLLTKFEDSTEDIGRVSDSTAVPPAVAKLVLALFDRLYRPSLKNLEFGDRIVSNLIVKGLPQASPNIHLYAGRYCILCSMDDTRELFSSLAVSSADASPLLAILLVF